MVLPRCRRLVGTALALAAPLLLGGCGSPSTLAPEGPKGADDATLFWVMLGVGAAVFAVVSVLLLYATFRPQRPMEAAVIPSDGGARLVIIGGVAIPALLLVGVFGFVLYTMASIAAPSKPAHLAIEVIGHRWWWEVRYPGLRVTTANELHVPVGQAVTLRLTSDDVIHSFWVPQIQEKTDVIPGRLNSTWFQVSQPGVYTGECAEYCGVEHAKMDFRVVAQTPAQFRRWVAQQQRPAPQPATPELLRGEQVFLGSACVYCHTIAGTNASGEIGPDLTHFAGRLTLGAGIWPNTVGNLAGWIANSQAMKPGNAMPPMVLPPDQLQALLAYLESLK